VSGRVARTAVAWAEAEGWNPGLDDAERFVAAAPDAFLAADDGRAITATVSCALYGERYSFVGFFIVRPDLRGRGVGSALFDRALVRAGRRVVGLDGVLAQQAYYERRGFVAAYRNVRWRTAGGGDRPAGVLDLSAVPCAAISAFDATVFGAPRERFLAVWAERPPGHALACLRAGEVAGYGVIRPCRVGAKVGPLFAADEEVADALLKGLLAAVAPDTEVFVDMPTTNAGASELRTGRAMEPVFETVRMYRNGAPPEDLQKVYGVTTLEFG
jgi:GNAT superfamily N-acetyltransferase